MTEPASIADILIALALAAVCAVAVLYAMFREPAPYDVDDEDI